MSMFVGPGQLKSCVGFLPIQNKKHVCGWPLGWCVVMMKGWLITPKLTGCRILYIPFPQV